MTTITYPTPTGLAPRERKSPTRTSPSAILPAGAWRYSCQRRSRGFVVTALIFSAGLHVILLFGSRQLKKPVVQRPVSDVMLIALVIPEIKELEPEPETVPSDPNDLPTELSVPVPMQADLPQVPQPSDFVQKIDFSSLIERPDLSEAKIMSIPDSPRGGTKIVESLGNIFNLSDLDRIPEPIFQPPPAYPNTMKRDVFSGTVVVEFIVNTEGRAINAFAFDSTHTGFNEAAVTGVERWKFRPGVKAGRKVNTRMRVPINFTYKPGQ